MPNNDGNIVKRTEQYIANISFDDDLDVAMVEQVGTSSGTDLNRRKVNTDGSTDNNLTKVGGTALTLGQKTSVASIPVVLPSDQTISVNSTGENALVTDPFDYISLSNYSGANPGTITFKSGGSAGTTVATLTLVYSGDNVTSITKA